MKPKRRVVEQKPRDGAGTCNVVAMVDIFVAAAFHAEFESSTGVVDDERLWVVLEEHGRAGRWCTSPAVSRFRTWVDGVVAFVVVAVESPAVGDIALVADVAELPAGVALAPGPAAGDGALAVGFADVEFRVAADVVFLPIPASQSPIAPLPFSPPPLALFLAFPSLVAPAALACAWLAGITPAGAVVVTVELAVVHAAAEPAVAPAAVAVAVLTPSGEPAAAEQDQRP